MRHHDEYGKQIQIVGPIVKILQAGSHLNDLGINIGDYIMDVPSVDRHKK